MKVFLPSQFILKGKLFNNTVVQLQQPEIVSDAEVTGIRVGRHRGKLVKREKEKDIIVLRSKRLVLGNYDVARSPYSEIPSDEQRFSELKEKIHWLKPVENRIKLNNLQEMQRQCVDARNSWRDEFSFNTEEQENNQIIREGLRSAQLGALHATLGYWTTSSKPATVVMPTGTGKTETMLALLVNQRLERLLVVVPTDALRTQIANKFVTLGLLKRLGVAGKKAKYPVVGILEHRIRDISEIEQFFQSCNVVITTMNVLSGLEEATQKKIAELCSHLFIDEAHHITAPTWEKFRRHFAKKTILQFTATPYRSDGHQVDGKIIFDFPLKKAQDEGYFKRIKFIPLREYNSDKHDLAVAKAAITQLDADIKGNLDHIVMARVNNIKRAEDVIKLYREHGERYNPVIVHSKQKKKNREADLQKLKSRQSRIVVCVDMFGEGFDLPELKIAALHDVHKSLAITIQFTGRFTRTKASIGDATIIANVANTEVEQALRNLYAEDADWNFILQGLSEGATAEQKKTSEFLENFEDLPPEIPIQNILPKMSTVVFKTNCINWSPEKIKEVVKESSIYAGPTINYKNNVALFVTCVHEGVEWANVKGVYNTVWNLYLIHWDSTQKLLYINSSDKSTYHAPLAKVIAGEDVELIRGEQVYRSLSGINRLILTNLGLKHAFSRANTYTMHAGSDVGEGMTDAHVNNKIKANLFGTGFEDGHQVSIGCSRKGKVWARMVANSISEWTEWATHIGSKLLDDTIKADQIIENAIIPETIDTRPDLVPLTIDWSEDIFIRAEDVIKFDLDGENVPFYEVGLELSDHNKQGNIKFRVYTDNKSSEYEIKISEGKVEYLPVTQETVSIIVRGKRELLSVWMQKEPPTIRFEDGTFLIYNEIYKLKNVSIVPYSKDKIQVWDWTGTDLSQESQTSAKKPESIQFKVLQNILQDTYTPQYDIVFDDDDAYESADIVAIKIVGSRLIVHLYHCKYAKDGTPGARIDDLYVVCGQAQKSVMWKGEIKGLMRHLRKREISRINKTGVSRFEKGDLIKLEEIENKSPILIPEFKTFIVQPGLSKTNASNDQLTLLAVTELYSQETYSVDFEVIASS